MFQQMSLHEYNQLVLQYDTTIWRNAMFHVSCQQVLRLLRACQGVQGAVRERTFRKRPHAVPDTCIQPLAAVSDKRRAPQRIDDACTTEWRHFYRDNLEYMKPFYPLPAPLVYNVVFEDACHCGAHQAAGVSNEATC